MAKKRRRKAQLRVRCNHCGKDSVFEQPYAYHAGFGNQGFLYNDAGTLTLVWSTFDPAYTAMVREKHPWGLTQFEQRTIEEALRAAPSGGRWRFTNPARCVNCASVISGPMVETIYYLEYPGSVITDESEQMRLGQFLDSERAKDIGNRIVSRHR